MEGGQKREPEKDARIRRKRKRREIHSGRLRFFPESYKSTDNQKMEKELEKESKV